MSGATCDNLDDSKIPSKKLKQARLVFKPLSSPSTKDSPGNSNKRKLADVSDDDIIIIKDIEDSKENQNISISEENENFEHKELSSKKKKIYTSDDEQSEISECKKDEISKKKNFSRTECIGTSLVNSKEPCENVCSKTKEEPSLVCKDEEKNEEVSSDDKKTDFMCNKPENVKSAESMDLDETSSCSSEDISICEQSPNISVISHNVSQDSPTSQDVFRVLTPSSEQTKPKVRKVTPKQLEKQREREKLRLEKERKKAEELEQKLKIKREKEELKRKEKEELKRKEQEEKEKIRKEKEDQKREKEELRKKELEEKELKRKEKEEKRLAEIEQKNEEKRFKEEEKRKQEEEKKKQEEMKHMEEKKVQAAFASFFVKKQKTEQASKSENPETTSAPTCVAFMPFQEKPFMKLAPINRVNISKEKLANLESALKSPSNSEDQKLYLDCLKLADYKKGSCGRTYPYSNEDEVQVVDSDCEDQTEDHSTHKVKLMRAKLLQFHDNHRPPYYGTWRKKSKTIKPRIPFKKDAIHFDYEVDSDDEWEEGEGESLRGSDDEKESEDDYEVDNEVFVPHGYLSDEEAQEEDVEDVNPEAQKLKLKLLGEEFEAELHEKTERLKPILVGPLWICNNVEKTNCVDSRIVKYLMTRRAVWKEESSPISLTTPSPNPNEASPRDRAENSAGTPKSRKFSDEEMKNLIRIVHGNVKNRMFLGKEFLRYLESQSSHASLNSVLRKIKEIATHMVCPSSEGLKAAGKRCWYVSPEIRAQYGLSNLLASDNRWNDLGSGSSTSSLKILAFPIQKKKIQTFL